MFNAVVERIRELIDQQKLTPTQFADRIGVARPIVSHILSGRNKPSLEVVQKISEGFPEVTLSWLLKGTGPMLSNEATSVAPPAPPVAPPPRDVKPPSTRHLVAQALTTGQLLSAQEAPAPISMAEHQTPAAEPPLPGSPKQMRPPTAPPAIPSAESSAESIVEPIAAKTSVAATNDATATEAPNVPTHTQSTQSPALQALAAPTKRIRRIVIFYNDGTFADYQPEPEH